MSTVNFIQPSEPRLQPGKSPQVRNGEPFSDHLESAAKRRHADENARGGPTKRAEPTASRSRDEARTNALARDETRNALAPDDAGAEPAAKPETAANEPRAPEDCKAHEDTADETSGQVSDTVNKSDLSESEINPQPIFESLNNDTVVDAETPAANVMTNDGEAGEADVSPQIASAPAPQITDGKAENADSTQAPATTTPVNEQSEGAPEAAPATAGIAPNMNSDDQTASTSPIASKPTPIPASTPAPAQPATPLQADSEANAANAAPVEQARGAAPPSEQPQQVSSANNAAMAAQGEASTPFEGDPDAQLPQRQNEAQPIQAKPQETKASPQAEIAKPVAPATDAGSPKAQPVTLPEPVRALAASFNPPGLQVASLNDRKPLPLNAAAIAVEIVSRLRDGMRRFDIRLDPPELGRIDVRLEMDRNGNVSTKLTLDRPETLELMQRDARGLERALQQAGLKTDAGGLEFSLRSHADNNPEHGHAGRSGHPSDALFTEDGERIEAVIEGYRAAAFARGGVDIRI